MKQCSVCKKIKIVQGSFDDYMLLAQYHYRESRPGPFEKIFVLRNEAAGPARNKTIGVIVYSMPSPRLELRGKATDNFFSGFDKGTQLGLINKNIRCISRLIIEPRFRGLGLAKRLVQQTMPKMNVPIIEAVAVMGRINPFFEKAGMRPFTSKPSQRFAQFIKALSIIGIEGNDLIDPQKVQRRLSRLKDEKNEFIEREIKRFLKSYGRRRNMPPGLERTRFILSRLNTRPDYYIWFNESISNFNFNS
ncbi:MAG: hypothetical protein RQ760_12510 [Sedimentisphaerales bacterium]|nr:hypothetical protein [Sedimentisphaerales bacterium]